MFSLLSSSPFSTPAANISVHSAIIATWLGTWPLGACLGHLFGLRNIGDSCYANATLQAVLALDVTRELCAALTAGGSGDGRLVATFRRAEAGVRFAPGFFLGDHQDVHEDAREFLHRQLLYPLLPLVPGRSMEELIQMPVDGRDDRPSLVCRCARTDSKSHGKCLGRWTHVGPPGPEILIVRVGRRAKDGTKLRRAAGKYELIGVISHRGPSRNGGVRLSSPRSPGPTTWPSAADLAWGNSCEASLLLFMNCQRSNYALPGACPGFLGEAGLLLSRKKEEYAYCPLD